MLHKHPFSKKSSGIMDFENSYINSLSGRTAGYNIQPGKLYLRIGNDSMFTYRKVD